MLIKGTEKLQKRTLNLASINQQITISSSLPIRDDDYWNSDIQMAMKMGLIEVDGEPGQQTSNDGIEEERVDRIIKCKNIYSRSITMNEIDMEIKPGQTFVLKESQLNYPDIRAAIGKGLIAVMEANVDADYSESSFSILDITEDLPEESEQEDENMNISDSQQKLVESVQEHQSLETNEEIVSPMNIIDTENPNPISVNKTPEGMPTKGVIWNPTGRKVIQQMTGAVVSTGDTAHAVTKTSSSQGNIKEALHSHPVENNTEVEAQSVQTITPEMIDSEDPIQVDPNIGDPRQNTIVVNPDDVKVTNTLESTEHSPQSDTPVSEVSFVDKEAEENRIKQHPVLSKKSQSNDDGEELDFLE